MQATNVMVRAKRAPSAYNVLRGHSSDMDTAFLDGYHSGYRGRKCLDDVVQRLTAARVARGFAAVVADLLTPPDAQHKLSMAVEPSFGLTLAHAALSGHELCPWRTDACSSVCVLDNGNGRYDSVQRAWLWRTDFLLADPVGFAYRLGWELGRAVRKYERKGYERILFRPNVNSDLPWFRLIPSMGSITKIVPYGYTKDESVMTLPSGTERSLALRGVRLRFHEAYSYNEGSELMYVRAHLQRGGRVAVVTNRKKGQDVDPAALRAFFGVDKSVLVRDADATDEWMITPSRGRGVIGDLTAKGEARKLIGRSGFVVVAY